MIYNSWAVVRIKWEKMYVKPQAHSRYSVNGHCYEVLGRTNYGKKKKADSAGILKRM